MKKSTLVAVGVFVALAVGVVLSITRKAERGVSRVTFKEVDHQSITRVAITGKNPVTLEKDGDAWKVEKNGKAADPNMVKRLVEAIPTIDTTDLVTRSSERFAELEVDEEKGARVRAFAGAVELADFWVGKSAKGGSYLRVGDAVYVAPRIYASTFSRQVSQWLQRKLFEDKLADVIRVEVRLAGKPAYTLVKKDNTWDLEDASIL
ncbi:MAG: DUF4340 domain-containing protein, partial [Myxococcota bacterium]